MQVVILCGGKGTRMDSATRETPKHLIDVGCRPILWHVMKIYSYYGHKDFVLCLGYLGDMIREYFSDPANKEEDWNIEFVDTGIDSLKSERIKKAEPYIKGDSFLLAYGDDVSDVDINKVIGLHKEKGVMVTLTAFRERCSFGVVEIGEGSIVGGFIEKPLLDHWVNGGFYVVDRKVFGHIKPGIEFEAEILRDLAKENKVAAYKHEGFWMSMNTRKDRETLNDLWKNGAPWAAWRK